MKKVLIVYGSDIDERLLIGGLRLIAEGAELQIRSDYPTDYAEAATIDRQILAAAGQYSSVWFIGRSMPTNAGGLRQPNLPVFRIHQGYGTTDIDCDWYGDRCQVAVAGCVARDSTTEMRYQSICLVFQAVSAWLSGQSAPSNVTLHTVNRDKLPTLRLV